MNPCAFLNLPFLGPNVVGGWIRHATGGALTSLAIWAGATWSWCFTTEITMAVQTIAVALVVGGWAHLAKKCGSNQPTVDQAKGNL